MFCVNCGKELKTGAKFCSYCGSPVPKEMYDEAGEYEAESGKPIQTDDTYDNNADENSVVEACPDENPEGEACPDENSETEAPRDDDSEKLARENYDKAVAGAKESYNKTVAEAKESFNKTVAEAKESYNQYVTEAKESYDIAIATAREKYDLTMAEAKEDYNRAVTEAGEIYGQAPAEAEDDYDLTVTEIIDDFDSPLIEIQKDYGDQFADKKERNNQTESKAKNSYEEAASKAKDGYEQAASKAKDGYNHLSEKIGVAAEAAGTAFAKIIGASDRGNYESRGNRPYRTVDHPYHNLGGWLKAFVVCGYIGVVCLCLDLLAAAVLIIKQLPLLSYYGVSTAPIIIAMLVTAVVLVFCLKFILTYLSQIRKKDSRFLLSIHKTYLYCTLLGIISFIVIAVGFSPYYGMTYILYYGTGYWILMGVIFIISMIISMFVLTLYFVKSVRVRTYMGSDEYLRLSPVTKNIPSPEPADRVYETSAPGGFQQF